MILDELAWQQVLGVVVDFGFVGSFLALVLWIMARSPFSFNVSFHGGLNVGRNGHEMATDTNYTQSSREYFEPPAKGGNAPKTIDAPAPKELVIEDAPERESAEGSALAPEPDASEAKAPFPKVRRRSGSPSS